MKHQLFKNNTYLEIDTEISHLTIIGQVKDSTITTNRIPSEEIFNFPQESIEIHPKLMIIYEDPEMETVFINDITLIEDIIESFMNIVVKKQKLFVSIMDITVPAKEVKDMFYKCNQRAK